MAKDITTQISGTAGQGTQTIGELLAKACHNAGLFVFSVNDFESRIRGGHNSHLLKISEQPLSAPCPTPYILVDINGNHYKYYVNRIHQDGIIIINNETDETDLSNIWNIPLDRIAKDSGGQIASNTITTGLILAILGAIAADCHFFSFNKINTHSWYKKRVFKLDGYTYDVLKMLALGANAVFLGRDIIRAAVGSGALGVRLHLEHIGSTLRKAMFMTGTKNIETADSRIIFNGQNNN